MCTPLRAERSHCGQCRVRVVRCSAFVINLRLRRARPVCAVGFPYGWNKFGRFPYAAKRFFGFSLYIGQTVPNINARN